MNKKLIKNAVVIDEGKIFETDILIKDDFIERIDKNISDANAKTIDDIPIKYHSIMIMHHIYFLKKKTHIQKHPRVDH